MLKYEFIGVEYFIAHQELSVNKNDQHVKMSCNKHFDMPTQVEKLVSFLFLFREKRVKLIFDTHQPITNYAFLDSHKNEHLVM